MTAVRIMGSENDEAALGKARCEPFVSRIARRFRVLRDRVFRQAFQTVLADNHRPPFARFQILWQQQHAPGKNIRPDVEHHVVTSPFLAVMDLAAAWVQRQDCFRKAANHLIPKSLAQRRGIVVCPTVCFGLEKIVPSLLGLAQDPLSMLDQFFDLTLLPLRSIEVCSAILRLPARIA